MHFALRVSSALALALALVFPAGAQTLDDGLRAFEAEDYPAALNILTPLAEDGIGEAQYRLGAMYSRG